jgi:hypothetical protein
MAGAGRSGYWRNLWGMGGRVRAIESDRPSVVRGIVQLVRPLLADRDVLIQLGVWAEPARRIVGWMPLKPTPAAPDREAVRADLLGIAQSGRKAGRDPIRMNLEVTHHS